MKFSRLTRILRPLLFIFGLLFIAILFVKAWEELRLLLITIDWLQFIFSVFIALMINLCTILLMRNIFNKYDMQISFGLVSKIYFYGQVAKYIPGKIWTFLYQAALLESPNVKLPALFSVILFVNLDVTLFFIVLLTCISLFLLLINYSIYLSILIFLLGIIVNMFIVNYCFVHNIVSYVFRRINNAFFGQLCLCRNENFSKEIFLCYLFFFPAYISAYALMMHSVFDFSLQKLIMYTAFLCISWVIGVISFVVPGGMGVRELIFLTLAQSISTDVSILVLVPVVLVARIWILIQEILGVFVLFCMNLIKKNKVGAQQI